MAIFIVDRRLPGLTLEHVAAARRALAESSRRLSAGGQSVRYVRSTFAPAHGRWLCVFEAASRDLVRRVNEVAQVPFDSIEEALDFEEDGERSEDDEPPRPRDSDQGPPSPPSAMAGPPPQRNLILILAREFASRLATAVFLVDAEGRLIYFNEPAERLLGQPFIEGYGMTPEDHAQLLQPRDDKGNLVPIMETPLGIAITGREPGHARLTIHAADGVTRPIETTAFPLLAHKNEPVGAIAVFWEPTESG